MSSNRTKLYFISMKNVMSQLQILEQVTSLDREVDESHYLLLIYFLNLDYHVISEDDNYVSTLNRLCDDEQGIFDLFEREIRFLPHFLGLFCSLAVNYSESDSTPPPVLDDEYALYKTNDKDLIAALLQICRCVLNSAYQMYLNQEFVSCLQRLLKTEFQPHAEILLLDILQENPQLQIDFSQLTLKSQLTFASFQPPQLQWLEGVLLDFTPKFDFSSQTTFRQLLKTLHQQLQGEELSFESAKQLKQIYEKFGFEPDLLVGEILSNCKMDKKLLNLLREWSCAFVKFVDSDKVRFLLLEMLRCHKEVYGENELGYDLAFSGLEAKLKGLGDEEYVQELIREIKEFGKGFDEVDE